MFKRKTLLRINYMQDGLCGIYAVELQPSFSDEVHFCFEGRDYSIPLVDEEGKPTHFVSFVDRNYHSEKKHIIKRRKMPRIFKIFFYTMLSVLCWRFVMNVEEIILFIIKLIEGQL